MVPAVLLVKATASEMGGRATLSPYVIFKEEEADDRGTLAYKAVVNAMAVTSGMLLTTVGFFFLYKYHCSVLLTAWLGVCVCVCVCLSVCLSVCLCVCVCVTVCIYICI